MSTASFFELATSRPIVIRALKVSAIVGSILAFINHGDTLIAMNLDAGRFFKIALTYCVPYCVSTYSSVKAIHGLQQAK